MHPLVAAALVLAATWQSWRWYLERVGSSPEEAAALGLTVVYLGALGRARRRQPDAPHSMPLWTITALLLVHAASCFVLPSIGRAAIAIAATFFVFHVAVFREKPPIAFWGLVALALPVLPSLQFVLGCPLRVMSAAITVALLQQHGFLVERQGTFLIWRNEMIQIDAACSGVNMLWAGLMLSLMGCVLFRLRALQVVIAVLLSVLAVVAANVLRTSSLFYLEAGFIPWAAAWWHEAIGIAAFLLAAAMILWLLRRLREGEGFAWAR
ncbi:MAG: exosortase/archaeosortase family protein [Xanthobacteraceae bacterium]|nr:exosortase/archaeosortase family protein [Xanthobacteraceae bacterium]